VILFDLSRLLSRAGRQATGIDRVELAYGEHLLAGRQQRRFVMMTATGRMGRLPDDAVEAFLAAVKSCWRGAAPAVGARARHLAHRLHAEAVLRGERAPCAKLPTNGEKPVYLLVSHHHLEKTGAIRRLMVRGNARFVCLIHDVIPIDYPEYVRPAEDERHRRRIETAAHLADAIIVASTAVQNALQPYLNRARRAPPVLVAPFGVALPAAATEGRRLPKPPYFVCVGTIEPRKNHLLLLNLWRRLAAELDDAAPRLILIGRRGWEAENVIDMLDRCSGLGGLVTEYNALGDAAMVRLIQGARALVLPSFVEGFGLPLAEALALGVPVLCSDIPALHEIGGAVPDYLDPLDGAGWRKAILDYAATASPCREAQRSRLLAWRPTRWTDHFAAIDQLIAETCRQPRR
jgi:glycosyltransferase involved in cell wall biosynthesis